MSENTQARLRHPNHVPLGKPAHSRARTFRQCTARLAGGSSADASFSLSSFRPTHFAHPRTALHASK